MWSSNCRQDKEIWFADMIGYKKEYEIHGRIMYDKKSINYSISIPGKHKNCKKKIYFMVGSGITKGALRHFKHKCIAFFKVDRRNNLLKSIYNPYPELERLFY
ncbi:7958_t:CDS:1 [Scutellospora calospora]|uniref:7958_t:CDS:1 n=1 Tax=Scutellospora calospora TaxID=85575 RepID=A0ACA9KK75_9GLOM|nr:7958_t:CDS:1 [Scutellospora calospora]